MSFAELAALFIKWTGIVIVVIVAIVPITFLAAIAAIAFGIISGVFRGISNFIHGLRREINILRPVTENDAEPAYRSYAAGPGYSQMIKTIILAWKKNYDSVKLFKEFYDVMCTGILPDNSFTAMPKKVAGAFYIGVATAFLYISSCIVTGLVCAIWFSVLGCISALYGILLFAVKLVDDGYFKINKIDMDCSVCKRRSSRPQFLCPHCNDHMHKKLVPGRYGIWSHRCLCGKRIPSTFFGGRSKLQAFCPHCGSSLVSSQAKQIIFQLIGETACGKSVYLSAFFHCFTELVEKSGLSVEIPDGYKGKFDELEMWYQGENCPATNELDAQSYPILIDGLKSGIKRQFSLYDIAGEMFDGYTAESYKNIQKQFKYCSGLFFVLDPFCEGKLREARKYAGKSLSDFSSAPITDTVTNFFNYMISAGMLRIDMAWDKPVSVLITKSDVDEIRSVIGPEKVREHYYNNKEKYTDIQQAKDELCRKFLAENGFANFLKKMDIKFTKLHFFPVSSMGHSFDGNEYEPWGVLDALEYLLPEIDPELDKMIYNP